MGDERTMLSNLGRGGAATGDSFGLIDGEGAGDAEFVREGDGRRTNENLGSMIPGPSAGEELGEVAADAGNFTSTKESSISSLEVASVVN